MDLLKLTALELGRKIKAGEVTVREAVRAVMRAGKRSRANNQQLCDTG